jgi:rhodanese-related sulfurtransferase
MPGAIKVYLQELAVIAIGGGAIAFLANALSPNGITLTKDYFHLNTALSTTPPSSESDAAIDQTPTNPTNATDPPASRLAAMGLQLVRHKQVVELFHDPRYEFGEIVFVDARNSAHYENGHIPRAYQFDHYRMEEYVEEVLPACEIAEQVIVYCTGGECEDSEFAASDLIQLGLPAEKVSVYLGGITEWQSQGGPMELGARDSGDIQ